MQIPKIFAARMFSRKPQRVIALHARVSSYGRGQIVLLLLCHAGSPVGEAAAEEGVKCPSRELEFNRIGDIGSVHGPELDHHVGLELFVGLVLGTVSVITGESGKDNSRSKYGSLALGKSAAGENSEWTYPG